MLEQRGLCPVLLFRSVSFHTNQLNLHGVEQILTLGLMQVQEETKCVQKKRREKKNLLLNCLGLASDRALGLQMPSAACKAWPAHLHLGQGLRDTEHLLAVGRCHTHT
jgi:hypothetical protein